MSISWEVAPCSKTSSALLRYQGCWKRNVRRRVRGYWLRYWKDRGCQEGFPGPKLQGSPFVNWWCFRTANFQSCRFWTTPMSWLYITRFTRKAIMSSFFLRSLFLEWRLSSPRHGVCPRQPLSPQPPIYQSESSSSSHLCKSRIDPAILHR